MVEYEIIPLPMAKGRINAGYMSYLLNYDRQAELVIYSWYIKGPEKHIIVDSCAPMAALTARRSDGYEIRTFDQALEMVGLTPEDVDIVIQTQLHYDHCGNTARCKNAEVIVQKKELDYALDPHPLFALLYDRPMFQNLNFRIVDGDTRLDEGIELLLTPGHSPGGQSVAVQTAGGQAVITGFCCDNSVFVMPDEISGYSPEGLKFLESVWPVRAPGIHVDATAAYDSALRVKELADIIVPIHDPMFEGTRAIPG